MSETKKEIKFFTITEWEKEQDYLRDMHKKGWKFTGVSFLCIYHFEKCRPEDVIYQLDYNQQGLENREEYLRMFSDCGWEYLQDCAGYSYFRKPASAMHGHEEIFCDDRSRMDMMDRVFRGRLVPLLLIFCLVLLPNTALLLKRGEIFLALIVLALVLIYLWVFISFWKKYRKFKESLGK